MLSRDKRIHNEVITFDVCLLEPGRQFIVIFQFSPNTALIYRSENHCHISCEPNLFCIQYISTVTRNSLEMLLSKTRSLLGAQIACLYAIYHKNKPFSIKTFGQICQFHSSSDLQR